MRAPSIVNRFPWRNRTLVQVVLIVTLSAVLGLVYNSFNPDGIPLVKKRSVLQLR